MRYGGDAFTDGVFRALKRWEGETGIQIARDNDPYYVLRNILREELGGAMVEFGDGKLVADTGKWEGKPAVFIAHASQPGEVGSSSARERHALDRLQPGEHVLTFPTEAQAQAVADAICTPV